MEFANNYANTRNSPRIASSLHNSTIPKICEHMKILDADKRENPATGNPVTLNRNINALFLRNNGGQDVELSADNSVALNAVLKR